MANETKPNVPGWTDKDTAEFNTWLCTRPPVIQEMGRSHPPSKLYLLKSSGHRVLIYSYSENRTMTVTVLGKYNLVAFERHVFGIKPEELEPCDPPGPDEPVGATFKTPEEIEHYIAYQRIQ